MIKRYVKEGGLMTEDSSKHGQTGYQQIKPYKKDADYSYTLGAFPTYELIKARPEQATKVIMHSSFTDMEALNALCSRHNIPAAVDDKLISRLSDKENCYTAGIFAKYECRLSNDLPHIVLVNPGNMGNLGTILRTAVGFGIYDVAVILPAADIYNPKTIRASMGAFFRLRFHQYASFSDYCREYPEHEIYTFMLDGERSLSLKDSPGSGLFSLVFGNEATGLDASYKNIGTSIYIPQTEDVDSLNLTIAVGIAAYVFTNQ